MSLAAETRQAVERHPFLYDALRAGVVNYTAAARFLRDEADVDGETEAVATALRRYAADLETAAPVGRETRVRMQSGVGSVDDTDEGDDAVLTVGRTSLATGANSSESTALIVTGEVGGRALAAALESLAIDGIDVVAAGLESETMVIVVDRLDGANGVRAVERGLASLLE